MRRHWRVSRYTSLGLLTCKRVSSAMTTSTLALSLKVSASDEATLGFAGLYVNAVANAWPIEVKVLIFSLVLAYTFAGD